ncbi:MAG: metallophosphoesterase [Syntrophobacter sp.]
MKRFFFGDIHGNEYALEACLACLHGSRPDEVYCLGDLVGWLPFGDRTLARMRSLGFPTVAGNHDLLVAGAFKDFPEQLDRMRASAFNAGLLSTVPGAIDYLLGLPLFLEGEDFIVIHHSPFHLPARGKAPSIECFDYLTASVLESCLGEWRRYPKRIIFSGHDHVPAVYELPETVAPPRPEDVTVHRPSAGRELTVRLNTGSRYWVKAGSVGGPYRDGVPLANAVIYDDRAETITLLTMPFATDLLHRELVSHFFAPTLPTIRKYMDLLGGALPAA